ncbi:MAG: prepilin-type N-terminal cleavage/methylation domain-containing protein [Oscillatoria sp. SIO1A7]|nr:prepilin-type N-terminal cleavage/methylation domain-containing protein [Oscillatoria sp. SIO1A7]
MKAELRVKFLQHLNKTKREEGFTLIELLVVVIIIGILCALALPSLLSQVNKAKYVEARNNIGTLNRAQQAYHLENNEFTGNIGALGIGIQTQTVNYQYSIVTDIVAGESVAASAACAIKPKLKAYQGRTYSAEVTSGGITEAVTRANLFQSVVTAPSGTNAANPYCGGANKPPATPGGSPPTEQGNTGWKNLGG